VGGRFPGEVHKAPHACVAFPEKDLHRKKRAAVMGNLLHYAIVFLVVALIAAAIGFGGVAGFAMEAARLLFWVFIVLFVVSLVVGFMRRGA
jgi:uncharacterized membrane protein YtjA (UPF0391 family)